jgi:hypothetical protein
MKAAIDYVSKQNPLYLAGGVVLVIGAVYFLARKTITDVAEGVGGIVTGDNALTKGTAYEGAGIVGTAGAVANAASGGLFDKIGSSIGNTLHDWFGDDVPANDTYYSVLFPDGQRHAVNAASVTGAGYFLYGGSKYSLIPSRARDGTYTAQKA